MNVVFALDSFKSSLTSLEAGAAAAAGLRRVDARAQTTVLPLADGGEGTAAALVTGLHGRFVPCRVRGALGDPIDASYGLLPDGTAVIEMAAAAGIESVSPDRRNPMHTTTYGVGQLIADAVDRGCRRFWIGIGGSATNDGGLGMLQALGYGFFDAAGRPVSPDGAGLCAVAAVSAERVPAVLRECTFRVACDVTNPLCGPNGCSAVFGPQKGADAATVAALDGAMERYAARMRTIFPSADPDVPGSGAAGGMGFALRTALRAELTPGAELVLDVTHLDDALRTADVLVTGEGRLDAQTAMGKAPAAAARRARAQGVPVIALCGCIGTGADACRAAGIDAYFPVLRRVCTEAEALDPGTAAQNLTDTAEQVFRLWQTAQMQRKGRNSNVEI